MLFSSNKKFPIGINMSDTGIKIVQLKKARDNIKVQALGKIDLEKGLISKGRIIKKSEILGAINKLFAKPDFGSVNNNEIVASLPEENTFIKLIKIEKTPNQIADVIEGEIEKHFPVSLKEIYYDWQKIKESDHSCDILIGAAPKLIVNQYIDLFSDAKLSVQAFEIESAAICRSLLAEELKKSNKFNKNYCIIDIGASRASIIIYTQGTIATTMGLPVSSEQITEKIAKALEIKKDQAEKAKIICGLDKGQAHGIVNDILSDMINSLIKKIKEVLNFYNDNYSEHGAIDEILLCGGGANIKKIEATIFEALSIKTSIANPLTNFGEVDDNTLKIFTQSHKLNLKNNTEKNSISLKLNSSLACSTAIGLALRNIFLAKI